jgi:hypothetical protein
MHALVPNGSSISLTWANRHEYVNALRKYRRSEFSLQCDAMRRGLASVVPQALLSLFTWRELETQVCGRGVTLDDLELLKKV